VDAGDSATIDLAMKPTDSGRSRDSTMRDALLLLTAILSVIGSVARDYASLPGWYKYLSGTFILVSLIVLLVQFGWPWVLRVLSERAGRWRTNRIARELFPSFREVVRPLRVRRNVLEEIVDGHHLVLPSRRLADNGLEAWVQVVKRGYEGLVGKDQASPYVEGRTLFWLKVEVPQYREGGNRSSGQPTEPHARQADTLVRPEIVLSSRVFIGTPRPISAG